MGKIYIIDVTNRDGVQTAKLGLSKLEKTMINLYLHEMGVFQSEFGFPTTHHEQHYLSANLDFTTDASLAGLVESDGQSLAAMPNGLSGYGTVEVGGETLGVIGASTPSLGNIMPP